MRKSKDSNFSTPISPPPFGPIKDSVKRKETCFINSCTDFDEFGANCCCFGSRPLPSRSLMVLTRSEVKHPLDVKVKQNDVKIPILFYKFSVSNCVIYLFILEVGHTIPVEVKISSAFELSS